MEGTALILFLDPFIPKREPYFLPKMEVQLDQSYNLGPWIVHLKRKSIDEYEMDIPLFRCGEWVTGVRNDFWKNDEKLHKTADVKGENDVRSVEGKGEGDEEEEKEQRGAVDIWRILSGRLRYYLPIYPVGFWIFANYRKGIAKAIDPDIRSAVPFVTVRVEGNRMDQKMDHDRQYFAEVFMSSLDVYMLYLTFLNTLNVRYPSREK
jgi:hypothetical protein